MGLHTVMDLGREKTPLVIEAWNLRVLFQIPKLERLDVKAKGERNVHMVQALNLGVKAWLRQSFEERTGRGQGRWVDVECGYAEEG